MNQLGAVSSERGLGTGLLTACFRARATTECFGAVRESHAVAGQGWIQLRDAHNRDSYKGIAIKDDAPSRTRESDPHWRYGGVRSRIVFAPSSRLDSDSLDPLLARIDDVALQLAGVLDQ